MLCQKNTVFSTKRLFQTNLHVKIVDVIIICAEAEGHISPGGSQGS